MGERFPRSNVWAVVVVIVATLACLTGLEIAGAATTNLLTYVGAGVTPTVTILLIGGQLANKADDIRREVNGRFSEALSKIPPAEAFTPVNRGVHTSESDAG